MGDMVTPPESNGRGMQFGNWLLSPKTIRVVKGGFVLALLGAAWALFTEFTQLRGFVNLIASRIDLAFLWMCLFGVIWIITTGATGKVQMAIRIALGAVLALTMYGLDAWAPKPMLA